MRYFYLFLIYFFWNFESIAATFNSQTSGQFNSSGSWTLTSGTDSDGVPDNNDDVTILTGHNISCTSASTTNSIVQSVTINNGGTLTVSSPRQLTMWGNYINNGTESGNGIILFNNGIGTTISGTGTFSPNCRYVFNTGTNRTISAGTTIDKSATTTSVFNATVTNLGTYTVLLTSVTGTSSFINGSTGILIIRNGAAFSGGWLNASAVGNVVRLSYYSLNVVNPFGGIYHHLFINGTGFIQLNGNITCNGDFTINGGNSFSQNNFNLTIRGNFSRGGAYVPSSSGEVLFNGTSAQQIIVAGTAGLTFGNLRLDNSAGLTFGTGGYPITITRSITATTGTINLTNHTTTLTSDATATAIIGDCSNGNISNTTNFTMQRFVAARTAGYSTMAGDIVGQTLADWDDELLLVYAYSPPDFYPSVFGYDETSYDFVPITAATQTLDPGVGFEVYLDSDGSQTTFNNTTILNEGTPTIGDVDMSGYVTNVNDGWNLLGNPFHANLSWDVLHATTTDISTDIQFYDEAIEDYTTVSTGSGELIAPNQGFWVQVTGGSPNIVLSESSKSTSTSSNFRHVKPSMFGLRLKNIGETRFTSGTSFRFSTSPELEVKGSLPFKKVPHPKAPGLSSVVNGKNLKINLLNSTASTVTVPLQVYIGVNGVYTIEAENILSAETEGYNCITLIDHKTNQTVDLKNEVYQFSGDVNDKDRFSLVLSKEGDCKKSTLVDAGSNNTVNITRIGENTIVDLDFANETGVTITVIDLLGQQICPAQALNTTKQEVSIPLPTDFQGIYLVNVSFDNKTITRKLFR